MAAAAGLAEWLALAAAMHLLRWAIHEMVGRKFCWFLMKIGKINGHLSSERVGAFVATPWCWARPAVNGPVCRLQAAALPAHGAVDCHYIHVLQASYSSFSGGAGPTSSSGYGGPSRPAASGGLSQPIVQAGSSLGGGAGAATAGRAAPSAAEAAGPRHAAEQRLVDRLCTPAGLRAAPGSEDLKAFVEGLGPLDGDVVARLLEKKLVCVCVCVCACVRVCVCVCSLSWRWREGWWLGALPASARIFCGCWAARSRRRLAALPSSAAWHTRLC